MGANIRFVEIFRYRKNRGVCEVADQELQRRTADCPVEKDVGNILLRM